MGTLKLKGSFSNLALPHQWTHFDKAVRDASWNCLVLKKIRVIGLMGPLIQSFFLEHYVYFTDYN